MVSQGTPNALVGVRFLHPPQNQIYLILFGGIERRSDVLIAIKTTSRCPDKFERRRKFSRGRSTPSPANKNNPLGLFFAFFMRRIFLAPFAKFLELNFALNFLFVFPGIIIGPFAGFAGQFD